MDMRQILEDLVLLLLHLTSWREKVYEEVYVQRTWKGYDLKTLDALREKGYIAGSRRAKSVYLTEEGVERAKALEEALLPRLKEWRCT